MTSIRRGNGVDQQPLGKGDERCIPQAQIGILGDQVANATKVLRQPVNLPGTPEVGGARALQGLHP